nr:MAG TPA: hypothetical protein [Caudoviricetes sp.]
MTKSVKLNSYINEPVYDISLDGTVVNALGMNVISNTDGFNFKLPSSFKYTKEKPYIGKGLNRLVEKDKEYFDEWGDLMEFNDLFMRGKMGLDEDEVIPANITLSRKNYLDLLDNGSVKMVGNTIKSKKMPIYIEKFIDKASRLLLNKKGKEFIEYYYDYIEKIYNLQIPLKEIATVGKIKISIEEYKEKCKEVTAAGSKKSRQAWYELAIKENLNVSMGDTIYYINTGVKKGESDIKRITKHYVLDSNGNKEYNLLEKDGSFVLNKKGQPVLITKWLEKEYKLYSKDNPDSKIKLFEFAKTKIPNIQEEDVVIFNCIMLDNSVIEDEENTFCDETFEYNKEKYIEMFNKRIKPLLVVFDKDIRSYIDEKGKVKEGILITNPSNRKYFTEKECELVYGQPFKETDEDTYEQLMTMEDKEIAFWLSINKKPTYIDFIDGLDWDDISSEYTQRMEHYKNEEIKQEIEVYNKIIDDIKQSDIDELLENGTLPNKLLKLIKEDYETGTFYSKKFNLKLGTIYDIIDKNFINNEIDE